MNTKTHEEKEVTRLVREINMLTGKLNKYSELSSLINRQLTAARQSLEQVKKKIAK